MSNPLPEHLAIIMDGNRTWAKKHGLSTIKGHEKGLDVARAICIYCNKLGIKNLTLYAFSIQNWSRPKIEIDALFNLFIDFFDNKSQFFHDYNLRFNPIGRIDELPKAIARKVRLLEESSRNNLGCCINVAINYGGREEILDAAKRIIEKGLSIEDVNEEYMKSNLYLTHNTPFKGGNLTRSKGNPSKKTHAIQLEMSKDLYMNNKETRYDYEKAKSMKTILKSTFKEIITLLK